MRSSSVTSRLWREPRMRRATDSVPDCFWCVAEFFRCSISPSAAEERLASSCCSCSGSSLMPLGSSVMEIGRPDERPGVNTATSMASASFSRSPRRSENSSSFSRQTSGLA